MTEKSYKNRLLRSTRKKVAADLPTVIEIEFSIVYGVPQSFPNSALPHQVNTLAGYEVHHHLSHSLVHRLSQLSKYNVIVIKKANWVTFRLLLLQVTDLGNLITTGFGDDKGALDWLFVEF